MLCGGRHSRCLAWIGRSGGEAELRRTGGRPCHAEVPEGSLISGREAQSLRSGEEREVHPGDAIAILPGQHHKLWNTGDETLRLLCCCAPAYEHDDTVIVEK